MERSALMRGNMRILMVTNTYLPARNGVAAVVSLYVRELRERGHDVHVLTYEHPRRTGPDHELHEVPAWGGMHGEFEVGPVWRLPEGVSERRFDVVHVHHPVLLGAAGVGLALDHRSPIVFTCHSNHTDYFDEYGWGLLRPLKGLLAARIARLVNRCDIALAPSTHVAAEMERWGVTTDIEMLEAAADTTRVPPMPREEARAKLGLGPDERIALYVGRISKEKRVDRLVDEFALAYREVPGARLILAGDGDRASEVGRRALSLGLDGAVTALPGLDGETLGAWYSAADVLTSGSQSETGPLIVVEAMACGTPCVAYDAPGFEDRISDGVNGLLVPCERGALGAGLARVLSDPELRGRLAAGAVVRAGDYTPAAVIDRLEACYTGLVADTLPRGANAPLA
jgi:1,2-diacylglycerol 3-alpha-glucosyltransferase